VNEHFYLGLLPNTPQRKMIGECTYKVVTTDYTRANGNKKLYLQCFQKGKKKMVPLHIEVPQKLWDPVEQKVKGNAPEVKDLNLIINQKKGLANDILVRYRLMGKPLTLEAFVEKYTNPVPEIDFIAYMDRAIDQRKGVLTLGSYKHHKATVNKLREFRQQILFTDINLKLIQEFKLHMKNVRKNSPNTIHSTMKLMKTYLNYAMNMDNIMLDFDPKNIKVPTFSTQRCYLTLEELTKLERYYHNEFCPVMYRDTLQVFLFSCFTGLRFSDLATITRDNIHAERLMFVPQKTRGSGKVVTLKLTQKALQYVEPHGPLFRNLYCNQVGNRNLKDIAKACGINKPVSWHVARHTFATTFLTLGGHVEVLQKLLGHAKITETMIYGQIVDARKDEQMDLFDRLG